MHNGAVFTYLAVWSSCSSSLTFPILQECHPKQWVFYFFWSTHYFGYKNISKCSFMILLLLFFSHLCETKVMQQLGSGTSATSIPFISSSILFISCLCTSFFYCPLHRQSSCKDEGHRQSLLRRNKRPFISFSYTINFNFFFKRRHGKTGITWIPAQIHMFPMF